MISKEHLFDKYKIDPARLPKHIAIIMDGNGRWAKRRNLPRILGHTAGITSVRASIKAASLLGIEYLTLYTFSTENWMRPGEEVRALMKMFVDLLQSETEELYKNNVRIKAIGRLDKLSKKLQNMLQQSINYTCKNTGLVFILAMNYGGRQEIVDAVKKIIRKKRKPHSINVKTFQNFLYDSEIPYPDLIIRTSGEIRLSNFLIWEAAYSEFWITKTLWPDFRKRHLLKAIAHYQKRIRKFGGVKNA
ncbi:MAG: isoprenyl transferase [Candidatus Cloacimonadota bacterium]|nr:MAG: isoprenyl transferase [Candidatus Cloacimonadota bacterium]